MGAGLSGNPNPVAQGERRATVGETTTAASGHGAWNLPASHRAAGRCLELPMPQRINSMGMIIDVDPANRSRVKKSLWPAKLGRGRDDEPHQAQAPE